MEENVTWRVSVTARYKVIHFWSYTIDDKDLVIPDGYRVHTVCSNSDGVPQWLIIEKDDDDDRR